MTDWEYRAQYSFPKDLRSCFVTRGDWPGIIAWMRENRLRWNVDFTEDTLFHGDSGDARFNCLFLGSGGKVRKWGSGAQDAAQMEAGISGNCSSYAGGGDLVLSAALFRSPQPSPPDLDF